MASRNSDEFSNPILKRLAAGDASVVNEMDDADFNITETFRSFFDGCTDITAQLKIVPSYNIFGII